MLPEESHVAAAEPVVHIRERVVVEEATAAEGTEAAEGEGEGEKPEGEAKAEGGGDS